MIHEQNATRQKAPWPIINSDNVGDNYGPGPKIKVRVVGPRTIYYNFHRRYEGDVFYLVTMYVTETDPKKDNMPIIENGIPKKRLVTAEEQFDPEKMEKLESDEPESITTAQQALDREQDRLNESKTPRKK